MVYIQQAVGAQKFLDNRQLQYAQLPVGNYKEVAAAAGRVQEPQAGQLVMEGVESGQAQLGFKGLYPVKLFPQLIQEQGVYELEYIFFTGVVGAKVATLDRVHDTLEHGTKAGW